MSGVFLFGIANLHSSMNSIAVSAVVRPSPSLDLAMMGMCLGTLAFGVLIGVGATGYFSLYGRLFIACFSIGSSLLAFSRHFRSRKSLRIDISGIGQIRLVEHTKVAQAFVGQQSAVKYGEEEFYLMEGSIIWPNLLFLHLKSNHGRMEKLRILPDSVTSDEFRALHVACRWIAARQHTETDAAF